MFAILDTIGHFGYSWILKYNDFSVLYPKGIVYLVHLLSLTLPFIAFYAGMHSYNGAKLWLATFVLKICSAILIMMAVYSFIPDKNVIQYTSDGGWKLGLALVLIIIDFILCIFTLHFAQLINVLCYELFVFIAAWNVPASFLWRVIIPGVIIGILGIFELHEIVYGFSVDRAYKRAEKRTKNAKHIEADGSAISLDEYLVKLLKNTFSDELVISSQMDGVDKYMWAYRTAYGDLMPEGKKDNYFAKITYWKANLSIQDELSGRKFTGFTNFTELMEKTSKETVREVNSLPEAYDIFNSRLRGTNGSKKAKDELDQYEKAEALRIYKVCQERIEHEKTEESTPRKMLERMMDSGMLPVDYIMGDSQKDRLALCSLWEPGNTFGRNVLAVAYGMSVVEECEISYCSSEQKDTMMDEVIKSVTNTSAVGLLTQSSLKVIFMMHRALYTERSFEYDPRPVALSFMAGMNYKSSQDNTSNYSQMLDHPEIFEKAIEPYLFFLGAMRIYSKIESAGSAEERLRTMLTCEKADILSYSTLAAALYGNSSSLAECANNAIKFYRLFTEYNEGEEAVFHLITDYLDGNENTSFDELCLGWNSELVSRMNEAI